MNDFSELEQHLKKLRPVQPSPDLAARIERSLAESPASVATAGVSRPTRQFNWNWLSLGIGLAAAATVLILARVNVEQPRGTTKNVATTNSSKAITPAATASELVPFDFTRVVYHTSDEGLRFPSGSAQPMRRVRSHTRETVQWRNPRTGASLRITYPSEEISLVPISGQ